MKTRMQTKIMLKKQLKIVAILSIFAMYVSCLVYAGSGQTTAEFLKIVPDPRAVALGEGAGALADSPGMTMNNPAGLAAVYQPTLSLGYVPLVEDIKYHYAGFGVPTDWGNIGGSLIYLDYGQIKGYTADTIEEYDLASCRDIGFMLSYAAPIKKTIPIEKEYGSLGINLKLIHSELADFAAEAVAIDLGGIIHVPYVKGLNMSVVGKNIGTKMKFNKDPNSLPESLNAGLGYKNPDLKGLQAVADVEMPSYGVMSYSGGISISPAYFVTLRCGWKVTPDSLDSGLRAGIGLNFGDFSLNYAMVPFKDYASIHRIGVEIAVGGIVKPEMASDHYLKLHFQRVQGYYYEKDYIAARTELEEITTVYPEYKPAKDYLEKVNKVIEGVHEEKKGKISKYVKKADVALSRKDFLAAKKYYELALRNNADQSDAKAGMEKVTQALAEVKLEETRKLNSDKILNIWQSAMQVYKKGDYVKAKEKLTDIVAIDPKHEEAQKYLIEIDNQLAKVTANQVNELFGKAMDFYKAENYEKALKYFEAVVIAAPHRTDAQEYIVKCQQAIKDVEDKTKAEKIAREQGMMKGEIDTAYNKALNMYEKGDYTQALEWFVKTEDIAEKYEFRQYAEDTARYMSLIKFSLSEQYYKSGYELFQKNKFEEAMTEYRKSLQYNPDNVSTKVEMERLADNLAQHYYEKGMNYYTRGDLDKAKEMFKKSLSYKSNKEESLRALERIQ